MTQETTEEVTQFSDKMLALTDRIFRAPTMQVRLGSFIKDTQFQGRTDQPHPGAVSSIVFALEHGAGPTMEPIVLAELVNEAMPQAATQRFLTDGWCRCAAYERAKGFGPFATVSAKIVRVHDRNEIRILSCIPNSHEKRRLNDADKRKYFCWIVEAGYHRNQETNLFIGWRPLSRAVRVKHDTVKDWMEKDFSDEFPSCVEEARRQETLKRTFDAPFDYEGHRQRKRNQEVTRAKQTARATADVHLTACENLCHLQNNQFNRVLVQEAVALRTRILEEFKSNETT